MPLRFFASGKRLREVQGPGRNLLLRAKRFPLRRTRRKDAATGEYTMCRKAVSRLGKVDGKNPRILFRSGRFRKLRAVCGRLRSIGVFRHDNIMMAGGRGGHPPGIEVVSRRAIRGESSCGHRLEREWLSSLVFDNRLSLITAASRMGCTFATPNSFLLFLRPITSFRPTCVRGPFPKIFFFLAIFVSLLHEDRRRLGQGHSSGARWRMALAFRYLCYTKIGGGSAKAIRAGSMAHGARLSLSLLHEDRRRLGHVPGRSVVRGIGCECL